MFKKIIIALGLVVFLGSSIAIARETTAAKRLEGAPNAWIPNSSSYEWGTDANPWADMSTVDFTVSGTCTGCGAAGATTALDNLASVAINESLVSDTDVTDDLGTGDIRWKDIYPATIRSGLTAADTLLLQARDVDGTSWTTFGALTSADTPTFDLSTAVTIGGAVIAKLADKLSDFAATTSAEFRTVISDETGSGALVFATSPTFTTDTTTITDAIGTAQTVGETLINSTDAEVGAQQFSPVFEMEGQGWKTDATAETQEVKWGLQTRPVEGTANPTSFLDFLSSINGAAYAAKAFLTSAGLFQSVTGAFTGASSLTLGTGSSTAGAIIYNNGTNDNTVTMQSGVTATSYTMTLPTAVAGAGEFLTDAAGDGVLSWAAAGGGGAPTDLIVSSVFEATGRFQANQEGAGTFGLSFNGAGLGTSATISSSSELKLAFSQEDTFDAFNQSPIFSAIVTVNAIGTDASTYYGIGTPAVDGSGHTYTDNHIGFKIIIASSVATLFATQADGTTENASSALTTITGADALEIILVVNGSSSVDYFWRKNGGALSSATNLTTNLPTVTTNETNVQFSISNDGVATNSSTKLTSFSYRR